MAWTTKNTKGEFRALYRDPAGKALTVKDSNGDTVYYPGKRAAMAAGRDAESTARRKAPQRTTTGGDIPWGDWWDQIGGNRHKTSDGDANEKIVVEKHIRPTWGTTPLNRITNHDIKEWIKELALKHSPKYVEYIYYILKVSLDLAVDEKYGVLDATPCTAKMGLPKIVKKAMPYITDADIELYRVHGLRKDYLAVLEFAYQSGMRPSEVCGLHTEAINWDTGWCYVANSLVPGMMAIRPFTKNGGTRPAPLIDQALKLVVAALDGRELRNGCGLEHLDGKPCADDLIFRTVRGAPITPRNLAQAMRNVAKKGGFKGKSPYAARRGAATAAIVGGAPQLDVEKGLGHANLDETRGYHQMTPEVRNRLQTARDAASAAPAAPALTIVRPNTTHAA
jgi:integrase